MTQKEVGRIFLSKVTALGTPDSRKRIRKNLKGSKQIAPLDNRYC